MQTIWSGMKVENIEYYGRAVDKYIALLSYKMKCCVYNLRSKTLFVPTQQYFIMSACLSLLLALSSYKFLIEYSYTITIWIKIWSCPKTTSVTFLIVHFRVFPLSLLFLSYTSGSFRWANFSYRTLPGLSVELGITLVFIRIIRNGRWKYFCFQITAHASVTARELIRSRLY